MAKTQSHADGMKVRGFFRVQITEAGKGVMGDSGWCENQVTNDGILNYLVTWLGAGVGGLAVGYMALGTGGAPAAGATTLPGEIADTTNRPAVTSSILNSTTAVFTGAFASANSFVSTTRNIANIGLFADQACASGSIFAGNTFASSSCATNQSVNATYQIRFASV